MIDQVHQEGMKGLEHQTSGLHVCFSNSLLFEKKNQIILMAGNAGMYFLVHRHSACNMPMGPSQAHADLKPQDL